MQRLCCSVARDQQVRTGVTGTPLRPPELLTWSILGDQVHSLALFRNMSPGMLGTVTTKQDENGGLGKLASLGRTPREHRSANLIAFCIARQIARDPLLLFATLVTCSIPCRHRSLSRDVQKHVYLSDSYHTYRPCRV